MATTTRKAKTSKQEDRLTPQEIKDVKKSLQQLKEGKGKIVEKADDL